MITLPLDKMPDLSALQQAEDVSFAFRGAIQQIQEISSSLGTATDSTQRREFEIQRTALAVTICDRISQQIQNQPDDKTKNSISEFIRENHPLLLNALKLKYSTAAALRFEDPATQQMIREHPAMASSELVAKSKAYALALVGAEFMHIMDINGTVSHLDGKFFPRTEDALNRIFLMGKAGQITGDSLDSIMQQILIPAGVLSPGDDGELKIPEDKKGFQNVGIVTESGLRRIDYDSTSGGFVETMLSDGLSPDTIATVKEKLHQTLLSPEAIAWVKQKLHDAGCAWEGIEPGILQEREADGRIRSLTIALFGGLTKESRDKFRNPDLIESPQERKCILELITYRVRSQIALNHSFIDEPELQNKFQIGGLGSIDTVAATKGEIAYKNFVLPHLASRTDRQRPLAVITYGDRTQDRFGNDNPLRDVSILHGDAEPAVYTLSFECSGARSAYPIDMIGQSLLYTNMAAEDGGTAHAMHMMCDAAELSNFIFKSGIV